MINKIHGCYFCLEDLPTIHRKNCIQCRTQMSTALSVVSWKDPRLQWLGRSVHCLNIHVCFRTIENQLCIFASSTSCVSP
jgi:hypothetical protein